MPRLTLRTLLAYIDDTLEPDQARALGKKVAESDDAKKLIERIKKVTRRRGLTTPVPAADDGDVSDPNTVAAYLSDNLRGAQLRELEETCLESDVHLAEVAACHQILTLVLTEPVRVPPSANHRMYQLVEAPISDHNRKPGKTIPVSGVAPPAPEQADADDDAALLLGMRRYGAAGPAGGRAPFLAAAGAVAALLALAVFMALPHRHAESPAVSPVEVARRPAVPPPGAAGAPPETGTGTSVAPPPKVAEPRKPETVEPKKPETVEPKKPETVEPKKVDPNAGGPKPPDLAPLGGQEPVGTMDTPRTIVLTRTPDQGAKWLRLDAARNTVRAGDDVLALPGFKADVKLTSGVVVHLWGNTPEQVPMQPGSMVTQSRVRFHPAPAGLDADLTLAAGRIYLTAARPTGAKVRVRIDPPDWAGAVIPPQVWDVTLQDDKTDVLVQTSTAFVPGTPYTREGGLPPRTEARLVVVRGTADLAVPKRFESFKNLAARTEYLWDSKLNKPGEPHPLAKEDLPIERSPSLDGDYGKALQRVFADAAESLRVDTTLRVLLKERIQREPPPNFFAQKRSLSEQMSVIFPVTWAVYSQAAIADGDDAADVLKDLIDQLTVRAPDRGFARQAAVAALSSWVAQEPRNTELLVKGLLGKTWREEEADLLAHLLRGYASPSAGGTPAVDELVRLLDHENVAVREAALGNLIAFFDPAAGGTPGLVVDVAARGEPGGEALYKKFLAAWAARAEEIKARIKEKEKK